MKIKQCLRPIMFAGTASDVGKSVITTGFCRILKQDGYHPAPFKAQNMSLNSYATPDGGEIGRAQAVQAEACGIDCHTDMNPLLLKPVTDKSSQVVLHGRPAGHFSAAEYLLSGSREALFTEIKKAYHRLATRYSPIVLEGAGSISELNLKHRDITNMRMAREAGPATYLVADIDRGGVFASCYGTLALLDPEEKIYIKGIIINKFRGDPELFTDGRKILEDLCQVPVIGVVPFFRDIAIEEEDSIALAGKSHRSVRGKVNIAVILLDRLSNYTDFSRLEQDARVNLFYTDHTDVILKADIVILPGSKNTIEDLLSLRNKGITTAIHKAYTDQKTVIGLCGGFQMMGGRIEDPLQVESGVGWAEGLGLLPVSTVLQAEKTTLQRTFRFRGLPGACQGYEIHMGESLALSGDSPLNYFPDGQTDGYFLNPKCWGTYLHGILDNAAVIEELLAPYTGLPGADIDHRQHKEMQYDKLAARLDDAANFIPARLTALLMVLVTASGRGTRFIIRYGHRHKSPNAGYPKAALAGILDARFGGPNFYQGVLVEKPFIGSNDRPILPGEIKKVSGINQRSCLLMVLLTLMVILLKSYLS